MTGLGEEAGRPLEPARRSAQRPARGGRVSRWLLGRRLVLGFGVVAAVPIIVAAVHAVVVRWVPLGDTAYTAIKSFDVFTGRWPLVGQWSSGASSAVDEVVYSPGPLLFWLFALPVRLFDSGSMAVTIALVNVASVIGIVALAHRRGGAPFMFATAVAVPLVLVSMPGDIASDPWNSSAGLFPFALLVFLGWSLACGEHRLLPLTVLVASFVAQCHLTFVVPALGVLVVGVVGLVISRRGEHARWSIWRWSAASGLVGLLCWSAPLIDQTTNRRGNLGLLVDAATTSKPTLGADAGWRAVVHGVGIAPWWLREPQSPLARIGDLSVSPGIVAFGSTVLVLGALGVIALMGWRRRRRDVWAAAALGLVLCAAMAIDAATTPRAAVATVGYTLRWVSLAGMCVWLLLGWSVAALLAPARRPLHVRPTARLAFAGLGMVAVVGVLVAIGAERQAQPYREMRTISSRLTDGLPADRATRVDATSFYALAFQAGIVYWLRHEGRAVVAPSMRAPLGTDYARGSYDQVVRVDAAQPSADRAPGRRIVRVTYDQPDLDPPKLAVNLSLLPAAAAGGYCPPPTPRVPVSARSISRLDVVPRSMLGTVEASKALGSVAVFCGWAVSASGHRVPDAVQVFSDGRSVAAVRPTISRPDVARAIGGAGDARFGYSIAVPLAAVAHGGEKANVKLVAIHGDIAAPLAFDCRRKPHDLGC